MLWWLLRNRGIRAFLGMIRRLLTGKQRGGANLATAQAFWAEPEQFALIAGEAGLKVERDFPHQTLDKQRQPCNSLSRHNYVLRKQA